ncbi:hypothetical protein CHU98_g4234 [Xylaria longipes]|nr:hypothetical protein CHU98_g4234 [Xylaria longipes]
MSPRTHPTTYFVPKSTQQRITPHHTTRLRYHLPPGLPPTWRRLPAVFSTTTTTTTTTTAAAAAVTTPSTPATATTTNAEYHRRAP